MQSLPKMLKKTHRRYNSNEYEHFRYSLELYLLYVFFTKPLLISSYSLQSMYSYAFRHHSKKANMEQKNHQKLTPLSLASGLGRNEIFKEIIELQSSVGIRKVWVLIYTKVLPIHWGSLNMKSSNKSINL